MKKIFSILAMAAVVLCMASCALGGTERYKGGDKPDIKEDQSTVNGIKYDNTEDHCWLYTKTLTDTKGNKVTTERYLWETHFEMIAEAEAEMYLAANQGKTGDYVVVMTTDDNSTDCLTKNNKD